MLEYFLLQFQGPGGSEQFFLENFAFHDCLQAIRLNFVIESILQIVSVLLFHETNTAFDVLDSVVEFDQMVFFLSFEQVLQNWHSGFADRVDIGQFEPCGGVFDKLGVVGEGSDRLSLDFGFLSLFAHRIGIDKIIRFE